MDQRNLFVSFVKACIGKPYIWGGIDPAVGFDCNGVVNWALKQSGWDIPNRLCPAAMLDMWGANKVEFHTAPIGSIILYGSAATHINHVMTIIERWPDGNGMAIAGARGGDNRTISPWIALKTNACVASITGDSSKGDFYWPSHHQYCLDIFKGKS